MKYLGGKHSLAKKIAVVLESVRPEDAPFWDVFTGGGSILSEMSGERIGNDACEPLITLYRAWLEGWRPPLEISEDEYYWIQACGDPKDPITAFAGFGLSFGGKFFGGYARTWVEAGSTSKVVSKDVPGSVPRNETAVATRNMDRVMTKCRGVRFECEDFEDLDIPDGALVYLDPPYLGTTGYGFFKTFDHVRFNRWALDLARRCVVVLSEYAAPKPWVEVASFDVRKSNFKGQQTEKLFMVKR